MLLWGILSHMGATSFVTLWGLWACSARVLCSVLHWLTCALRAGKSHKNPRVGPLERRRLHGPLSRLHAQPCGLRCSKDAGGPWHPRPGFGRQAGRPLGIYDMCVDSMMVDRRHTFLQCRWRIGVFGALIAGVCYVHISLGTLRRCGSCVVHFRAYRSAGVEQESNTVRTCWAPMCLEVYIPCQCNPRRMRT